MIVRTEAVLMQLVFEHSLRIRLSAPSKDKKSEQNVSSIAEVTPSGQSQSLSEAALEAEEDAASTAVATESLSSESTQVPPEGVEAGEALASAAEEAKDSLVGTMTNLITTDLGVVKVPAGYILEPRKLIYSLESNALLKLFLS